MKDKQEKSGVERLELTVLGAEFEKRRCRRESEGTE